MASLAQDLTRKFVGDRKEDIESGRWIKVQQRVFTRWANAYLKTRKLHMEVHTVGGFAVFCGRKQWLLLPSLLHANPSGTS